MARREVSFLAERVADERYVKSHLTDIDYALASSSVSPLSLLELLGSHLERAAAEPAAPFATLLYTVGLPMFVKTLLDRTYPEDAWLESALAFVHEALALVVAQLRARTCAKPTLRVLKRALAPSADLYRLHGSEDATDARRGRYADPPVGEPASQFAFLAADDLNGSVHLAEVVEALGVAGFFALVPQLLDDREAKLASEMVATLVKAVTSTLPLMRAPLRAPLLGAVHTALVGHLSALTEKELRDQSLEDLADALSALATAAIDEAVDGLNASVQTFKLALAWRYVELPYISQCMQGIEAIQHIIAVARGSKRENSSFRKPKADARGSWLTSPTGMFSVLSGGAGSRGSAAGISWLTSSGLASGYGPSAKQREAAAIAASEAAAKATTPPAVTRAFLLDWLEANEIFARVLRFENADVLAKGCEVLMFIATERGLTDAQLDAVWTAALRVFESLQLKLFDFLCELVALLPLAQIDRLFAALSTLAPESYNPQVTAFVASFTRAAIKAVAKLDGSADATGDNDDASVAASDSDSGDAARLPANPFDDADFDAEIDDATARAIRESRAADKAAKADAARARAAAAAAARAEAAAAAAARGETPPAPRLFGLDIFWSLLMRAGTDGGVSETTVNEAAENLQRLLAALPRHRELFITRCVDNVRDVRAVSVSLQVLMGLLATFPERDAPVRLRELASSTGLLALLVKSIGLSVRGDVAPDDALRRHLDLIEDLTTGSGLELDVALAVELFDAIVGDAQLPVIAFRWFGAVNSGAVAEDPYTGVRAFPAFGTAVAVALFRERLVPLALVPSALDSPEGMALFRKFFVAANARAGSVRQLSPVSFVTRSFASLVGLDALWALFTRGASTAAANDSAALLADIYTGVSTKIPLAEAAAARTAAMHTALDMATGADEPAALRALWLIGQLVAAEAATRKLALEAHGRAAKTTAGAGAATATTTTAGLVPSVEPPLPPPSVSRLLSSVHFDALFALLGTGGARASAVWPLLLALPTAPELVRQVATLERTPDGSGLAFTAKWPRTAPLYVFWQRYALLELQRALASSSEWARAFAASGGLTYAIALFTWDGLLDKTAVAYAHGKAAAALLASVINRLFASGVLSADELGAALNSSFVHGLMTQVAELAAPQPAALSGNPFTVAPPAELGSKRGTLIANCVYNSKVGSLQFEIASTGSYQVAVYCVDYNTNRRTQHMLAYLGEEHTLGDWDEGQPLPAHAVTLTGPRFHDGQWVVWTVHGRGMFNLRLHNVSTSPNWVLSALLLDRAAPAATAHETAASPLPTLVKIDSTTQGQWQGRYGSCGGVLLGKRNFDVPSRFASSSDAPRLVSIDLDRADRYEWIDACTSDRRALQQVPSSGDDVEILDSPSCSEPDEPASASMPAGVDASALAAAAAATAVAAPGSDAASAPTRGGHAGHASDHSDLGGVELNSDGADNGGADEDGYEPLDHDAEGAALRAGYGDQFSDDGYMPIATLDVSADDEDDGDYAAAVRASLAEANTCETDGASGGGDGADGAGGAGGAGVAGSGESTHAVLDMLFKSLATNRALLGAFVSYPAFGEWLATTLCACSEPSLRRGVVVGTRLLASLSADVREAVARELETLVATLESRRSSAVSFTELFELVAGLARELPPARLDSLFDRLAAALVCSPIVELEVKHVDTALGGLLLALALCVEREPALGARSDALLTHVFGPVLFDLPTSKSGPPLPKAKSSSSRAAAFKLLVRLASGRDGRVLGELLERLADTLARSPLPTSNEWLVDVGTGRTAEADEARLQAYTGLKNQGCTCYLNASLQQMFMEPALRAAVLRVPLPAELSEDAFAESTLSQLQLLFAHMTEGRAAYVDTIGFCKTVRMGGELVRLGQQEDANEFINTLVDQLEPYLKGTPEESMFVERFGGAYTNQILSRECEHTTEREEPYLTVTVKVQNKRSLAEGLEFLVQGDMLDGNNKYHCASCDAKVTALKRACIRHLPNTLVLHLCRFEFSVETLSNQKVDDRFEFPHELDMRPYTREGLAEAEGRAPEPETLRPADYYAYELVGIVVHDGTAEFGHYYSYIRERVNPSGGERRWFEFNDRTVSEFDPADIADQCFGGPSTMGSGSKSYSAYILLYQRKSSCQYRPRTYDPTPLPEPAALASDPEILDKIWRDSVAELQRTHLMTKPSLEFMWSLVELQSPVLDTARVGDPLAELAAGSPEALALKTIQFGTRLCFDLLAHCFDAMGYVEKATLLGRAVEALVPAARWLVATLVDEGNTWLTDTVLVCPDMDIRTASAGLVVRALNALAQADRVAIQADADAAAAAMAAAAAATAAGPAGAGAVAPVFAPARSLCVQLAGLVLRTLRGCSYDPTAKSSQLVSVLIGFSRTCDEAMAFLHAIDVVPDLLSFFEANRATSFMRTTIPRQLDLVVLISRLVQGHPGPVPARLVDKLLERKFLINVLTHEMYIAEVLRFLVPLVRGDRARATAVLDGIMQGADTFMDVILMDGYFAAARAVIAIDDGDSEFREALVLESAVSFATKNLRVPRMRTAFLNFALEFARARPASRLALVESKAFVALVTEPTTRYAIQASGTHHEFVALFPELAEAIPPLAAYSLGAVAAASAAPVPSGHLPGGPAAFP